MSHAQRIRDLVRRPEPLVMAGVYDALSARLATQAGFEVIFVGGYSVAATALGEPDFGLLTQTEIAATARAVCGVTPVPVLIDCDTGYGNAINVIRTVREMQRAGAAGMFIEDQVWPKRCGHMRGKRVIPLDEHLPKLRAAIDARQTGDLFLVARTDARAAIDLDEAIRRGRAFRDLGVDAVFVEAPESVDELRAVAQALPDIPLVANMVEHGRTPMLSKAQLGALGFRLIVYPLSGLLAVARALRETYQHLRANGDTRALLDRLLTFEEFHAVIDLEAKYALDERYQK
ncbi:MAG TPA: isocitrate lyase/PEP mutase family protein [Candidatus Binatia bacterium]|nr:isocitrate lyase/PEP mutase family protein [Candidatus Binatia bacterium]